MVQPSETAGRSSADGQLSPGPARLLALLAAGLALVIYLLGFVDDIGLGTLLAGPLLLGGGLLAGAAVLPRAGRVLVPAAVAVTTGTLLMLQLVTSVPEAPTSAIIGLVLSFLLVAAVVGAALLDAGILKTPAPRSQQQPAGYAQPGYGSPGQYGQPPGYGGGYAQYPDQLGYGGYGGGQPGYGGYGGAQPGYGPQGAYGPGASPQPGYGYGPPAGSQGQGGYGPQAHQAGPGPDAGPQQGAWYGSAAPGTPLPDSYGSAPAGGSQEDQGGVPETPPRGQAAADPSYPEQRDDDSEQTRVIKPGERPPS